MNGAVTGAPRAGSGSLVGPAMAGTAGAGSPNDALGTDNGAPLITVTPTAGTTGTGAGGAAAAGPVAGDGCEVGKFCKPQMADSDCGTLELKTTIKVVQKPGNVLVIWDRSTSMEQPWNGQPKYQAAGNALIAALTPLKDLLTIGGQFFPSLDPNGAMNCPMGCNVADPVHWIPGPGACCLNIVGGDTCLVTPMTSTDQIPFGPAAKFLAALPMQWQFPMGGIGQTPLEAGVAEGAKGLAAQKLMGTTAVIIITDGEPNCMSNTNNVLDQVKMWQAAKIDTYVVGLPGAQGAADLLNMLAVAGNTKAYIDPKDPMDLQTRLGAALMSTVRQGFESCTIHLDPKAEVPDKLVLVVKQNGMDASVARDFSKDVHWKINAAGDQVDLEDQLCDLAKSGTFESIRFVFGCKEIPPLEPPPPPVLN